jgi:hypothetical protein
MRRGQIAFLTLLLLLAVPVASAAGRPSGPVSSTLTSVLNLPLAVGVTDTHATMKSWVVPGVQAAAAAFEFGPTTEYGATAAAAPGTLPLTGATATASVDGLAPSTTYHFRLVLSAAGLTVAGPDATFTTAAAPVSVEDGGDRGSDDTTSAPEPVVAPEAPVLGKSLAVGPRRGTVRVQAEDGVFEDLTDGATIESGTVIDATNGTVAVTTALDDNGNVQTGEFSGGRFLVRQAEGGKGMVDLYLQGRIGSCRSAKLASIARKKKPGRRLWGRDQGGRFRTHGADSVASVRGTRWLTEDTCAGTRTKVTEGAVSVRDRVRRRTVTVRAGHSYLARSPR